MRPFVSGPVVLALAAFAPSAHAQPAAPGRVAPDTALTRLLRHPTVSATHIAFAHAGDLWTVPREGGDARRLTTSAGVEQYPRFSPDGASVAFTAEYAGNPDVYVVAAGGGEPARLTWHPGADHVRGWTPDGSAVVFASGRGGPEGMRLWSVPVAGGLPSALPMPRANRGAHSPDGARVAYQAVTPWDVEWRNYRGGQAQPIRLLTLAGLEETKLPWQGSNDTDPVWAGARVFFLSDRDRAANVYAFDPATGVLEQRTRFRDFDAKNLSAGTGAASGALVFEQAGYVHLLDAAGGEPRRVPIRVRGDMASARPQWKDAAPMATAASLSPTGARALFEARGDVFTVPTGKGDVRNLTRSSDAADRSPAWSPDGQKIAWFSDAGGEYRLMIGAQDGLTPPRAIALPDSTFYFAPAWSPDSKRVAFTDEGQTLAFADVETGRVTRVDADAYMVPDRSLAPAWSPDSRWIAYAKRLPNQFRAVMAYSLDTGTSRAVTDGMSDAVSPAWDASGRYLYFLASTDFALSTGWLDMTSYDRPVTRAVYFAVLSADDVSPLLPESDEEAAPAADAPPAPAPSARASRRARSSGTGAPADTSRAKNVRIDFDGILQRVLSLDAPTRNYTSLKAGTPGVVYVAEAVPNADGLVLHRYDAATRKTAPFMEGVASFALSADGKKLLYGTPDAKWGVVDAAGPAKVGDGPLAFELRALVDPRAEWRQMFREAWRLQRDFFYVDNLHGADWDGVYRAYEPWVAHVGHRADLTHLLDVLGGETSVGHSFVWGGDQPAVDEIPVGLLGADFEAHAGRYRLKRILSGENWNPDLRAPLTAPGLKVNEGDYVLAVNGVDLRATASPYSAFEGTAGRQTVLRVGPNADGTGARDVVVVPVADEGALRARAWVEGNRRMVDRLSNGRLAYVYVPNTGFEGYTSFNRYYFAQQQKQGAVIDERYNGGGSAADYMIEVMGRRLYGYFNNPVGERPLSTAPIAGIWGPKVMVVNEMSGSGGDLLPYMFRHAGLGPIVGTRTWGGLVGIWDTQTLLDGGAMTNPRGGFVNLAGEWAVENEGVAPDIEVELTPRDAAAGRDPQLERAVQEALRLLDANPVRVPAEPAAPVRALRPGG